MVVGSSLTVILQLDSTTVRDGYIRPEKQITKTTWAVRIYAYLTVELLQREA